MDIEYLRKLFAYDDWANREALASLKAAGTAPERSLKLMAHIVAVQWLWMGRILRDRKPVAVWPELGLEECAAQLDALARAWPAYIEGLTPPALAQPLQYTNSKGEVWTNTVEDMLMHTILHSVYHRGQIAADMRASRHSPAYTDFIEALRRGNVVK